MTEPIIDPINPFPKGHRGGRPKGSKNFTPEEKRIKNLTVKLPLNYMKPEKVLLAKSAIIQLLETRQVETLSDAADRSNIPKLLAYKWRRNDLEWASLLKEAGEITADRIENEILSTEVNGKPISMPYVLARMFRLKALRPQLYKERYPINVEDSKMVDLLTEIKKIGQKQLPAATKETEEQKRETFISVPVLDI